MEAELCFPRLLNASCVKPSRPHYEALITYVLLFSVSLLTASLNLLVIVSISHFRQLHTPTNLLLLSLAVSDFLVGPLLLFQMVLIDGCWFLGDLLCSLYQYVAATVTSASVGTVVLISVDRYVAVCDPLHYSSDITRPRVQTCVCLCWICSGIFQSLVLQDTLRRPGRFGSCVGECVIVVNYAAGVVDVTFSFVAPIAVIVVLYARVFAAAAAQARAVGPRSAKRSELKAARTLGVVVVVFLACLCPYYCVALSSQDNSMNASSALYNFVVCLFCFNSCLNPLIYALFYPWFRKSVKLIVTLRILQPDSCEASVL